MTITPLFDPGDTVWFVDQFTQLPVSTTVTYTDIHVDGALAVKINYFVSINSIERYVNQDQAFASQADLAAYYSPA